MINATGYRVQCDLGQPFIRECEASIEAAVLFGKHGLYRKMDRAGWQRGVRKDGQTARRGGRDYCSQHHVGKGELRR